MYGWYVSKIKNLYLVKYFWKLPIYTSSIGNNKLHKITLIKITVAGFMGTGAV